MYNYIINKLIIRSGNVTQQKINRINELYKRSKITILSEEEKKEQAQLRKEYLEDIKKNLRNTLNNLSING